MRRCPECGHVWSGPGEDCPACSTATSPDDGIETVVEEERGYSETSPFPGVQRHDAGDDLRPGTLFAGRYRIEPLLGRGAMGVVYRAEDETLGQTVALKFLPPAFRSDPRRVERFLGEVRHAREIAHPNVCRVYDVGDADDRLFLSMEYIDGEDLASLLRRIGRLPGEKATDIARQLCAGLTALHEAGMLHRDLKPANVMLDGRGRVRLTDFGLAAAARAISGADIRSGTPQYMAPEQLEGEEVTERSDIYALGLLLYEIYTGTPAFTGASSEEFRRAHREARPAPMSSVVAEIDPTVERLVERCLEKDPAQRPQDVATVALALPGGDPLAAAVALGETPSPELVARAGGGALLRPRWGILLLVLLLSGLWVESADKGARSVVDHLEVDRPLAAQTERARALITELGYTTPPVDSHAAYQSRRDVLRWFEQQEDVRWSEIGQLWPSPLVTWYRQEQDWLWPQNPAQVVTRADPPAGGPGSIEVVLSHRGELQSFRAVPRAEVVPAAEGMDPAAIALLVRAAGLEPDAFTPAEDDWRPQGYADALQTLAGPDPRGNPIRVHVASRGDRVTEFVIAGPWDRAGPRLENQPGSAMALAVLLLILLSGGLMSARNLRDGRVDPRGAAKVALVVLTLPVLAWVFRGHHPPLAQTTLTGFMRALSNGALFAVVSVALYFAAEPVVRRVWPQMLISWTRATTIGLAGPTVGTALLAGAGGAGVAIWVNQLTGSIRIFTSRTPLPPELDWVALGSPGGLLGVLADQLPLQLFVSLIFTMVLVLLRIFTRSRVLAATGFILVVGLVQTGTESGREFGVLTGLLTAALWLLLLLRAGLLALVTAKVLVAIFLRFPVTSDPAQIHGPASIVLLGLVLGMATWALGEAVGARRWLARASGRAANGTRA